LLTGKRMIIGVIILVLVVILGIALLKPGSQQDTSDSNNGLGGDSPDSNIPDDNVPDENENDDPEEDPVEDPVEEDEPQQQVREFEITAKRWEFSPNPIIVSEGDLVKLKIKSIDVTHGIRLSEFGVNEILSPGNEVNVEFVADRKGSFSFFCTVTCGSGHSNMRGTLIVN